MTAETRLKFNSEQRREYLHLTEQVGRKWLEIFEGDADFYSAAYWDLLAGIWRADGPIRKTDALQLMHGIKSVHTAGKYLETTLDRGMVVETDNPQDARSKLVALSPEMRKKLDEFFDNAVDALGQSAEQVEALGSS